MTLLDGLLIESLDFVNQVSRMPSSTSVFIED